MRYLRWYRASIPDAPFLYIQAWSVQDAREQAREHYLYRRAKWIEITAVSWYEVNSELGKGE